MVGLLSLQHVHNVTDLPKAVGDDVPPRYVLSNYFSGEREKLVREANAAESLSIRMATEARHIWGARVAAENVELRGLPTVPAMKDAKQAI